MIGMEGELLKRTKSFCPDCLKVIEGKVIEEDGKALIKKECPEHGKFQDTYYSDVEIYKRFENFAEVGDGVENPRTKEQRGCPFDCGLCPNHKSHTVLSIIDVTNRCVTGDTEVILEDGNIERIENIVNEKKEGMVLSWDRANYVPSFEKIVGWQKLDAPEILVKVTSHTGKYTFTPDHEVLVDTARGPMLKRVDALKKGDKIYSLAKLPISPKKTDIIELLANSEFEFFVYGDFKGRIKEQLQQKFGSLKKASKSLGIKYERLIDSKISLSAKDLRNLREKGFSFEIGSSFIKIKVHHKTYKIFPLLDEDFYYLLGLIDSDRHVESFEEAGKSTSYISFFNKSDNLSARFLEIVSKYFPEQTVRNESDRIDLNNLVLVEIAKQIQVKDKQAFSNLFVLDEPSIAAFLAGYFDGDGHVTLESSEIAFTTVCPEIAKRLVLLLKRIGVISIIQKLKFGAMAFSKREHFFKTKVVGLRSKERFIELIKCGHPMKSKRLMKLNEFLKRHGKDSFVDSVPSHDLSNVQCYLVRKGAKITDIGDPSTFYKISEGTGGYSKNHMARQLSVITNGGNLMPISDNFFLDSVVNIELLKNHGIKHVYDLTVDKTHLFVINSNLIISNCNLRCPICFANAAAAGYVYEPTFEQIKEMLKNLRANKPTPPPAIQFSGGEPTIRDDLPDIVRAAKEAGFWHVEVNTNGIRLARDIDFIKRLREAGVSTIYLQFDGMTPEPTIKARGADILQLKFKALENCRKAGLTSIVLVVTLVKGVNDGQLGDIIRFAAENKDIVRCVNVQPVSFAGRISQEERERWRITIPDFMKAVEEQTGGQIKASDFYPVPSAVPISRFVSAYIGKEFVNFTCHEHCGAATYVFVEDGFLIPITRFVDIPKLFALLDKYAEQLRKRGFAVKARVLAKAAREVPGTVDMSKAPKGLNLPKILMNVLGTGSYKALAEFHERAILIACMHFQDRFNFDLDRIERCGIHYAVPDGRIIPFCTYNSIHRSAVERKFSVPLAEWQRLHGKN